MGTRSINTSGRTASSLTGHSDAFDLMDYTSDVVLVVDNDGVIGAASSAARRLLEPHGGSLLGARWAELIHPDHVATVAAATTAPHESAGVVGQRLRVLDAGGLWRWFELAVATGLPAAAGSGHLLILRDVGALLEGERLAALLQRVTALSNEAADLDAALNGALHDIQTTMDWSWGQVEHADPLDVSATELPSRDVTGDARSTAAEAARSGQPCWRLVEGSPDEAWLCVAVPIVAEHGTVAVLVFGSNIPEQPSDQFGAVMAAVGWQLGMVASRQAARRELEARDAELQRSNAELERFAYVASHDLQEPLRKVVTACELLERRVGDELATAGGGRYVEVAVDAAHRMQRLIRDLLAYSRIGRGNTEELEQVDLDGLVDEVRAGLSQQIEEARATVDVGPLPSVAGRRSELAQVVSNLLSNALKFRGDAAPHVRIAGHRRDGEVELTVTDNGIGIDPNHSERIFDVFRRLHRQDEFEGTGIGLAIAKRIVEHHGGRIWITDVDGGGSCFHVTLPEGEHGS